MHYNVNVSLTNQCFYITNTQYRFDINASSFSHFYLEIIDKYIDFIIPKQKCFIFYQL